MQKKKGWKHYTDLSLHRVGIVRFSSFCFLILSLWPGQFGKAKPRTYRTVVLRKNGEVEKRARQLNVAGTKPANAAINIGMRFL